MSKVEQRYRAVLAVQAGVGSAEVAWQLGVSRQSVHNWLAAIRARAWPGWMIGRVGRSRVRIRPPRRWRRRCVRCAGRIRRWGPRRIEFELGRNGCPGPVPSRMTVYRILVRHGLIEPVRRRRGVGGTTCGGSANGRWSCGRWTSSVGCCCPGVGRRRWSPAWMTIPGSRSPPRWWPGRPVGRCVWLWSGRWAVTGCRRRCSPTTVSSSPTGSERAGRCSSTGSAGRTAIQHRLTQPASPTTTGKVERFHQTLRRELLDEAGEFAGSGGRPGRGGRLPGRVQPPPPAPVPGHGIPGRSVPARTPTACLPLKVPAILADKPTEPVAPQPDQPDRSTAQPLRGRLVPVRGGTVGRSSSNGSCRRRGTCRWPGNSSGSARPARV